MRSFIKSHRNSSSLDGSPTKWATPLDQSGSQRHSNDSFDYQDSQVMTPNSNNGTNAYNNNTGPRHAPSFESFHRLANKKMFSSKLFRKNSNCSQYLPFSKSLTYVNESTSAPSTPRTHNTIFENNIETQSIESDNGMPSIKGTITHSWGGRPETGHSVIVLNNGPRSSISGNSTSESSDLESGGQVTGVKKDSLISSNSISSDEEPFTYPSLDPNTCNFPNDLQNDNTTEKDVLKVKNKNRKARIHSDDDIINLKMNSSVDALILKNGFRNNVENNLLNKGLLSVHEHYISQSESINTLIRNSDLSIDRAQSSSVSFVEAVISINSEQEKDTPEADGEGSIYSSSDADNDNESEFSFEYAGINGRTSSMKYYSKPEPVNNVYVDDLYVDENFDENLNYDEDSLDEMDFPSAKFHYNNGLDDSLGSEGNTCENVIIDDIQSIVDLHVNTNAKSKSNKKIKSYNDLFVLSDDEIYYGTKDDYGDETELMNEMYGQDHGANENLEEILESKYEMQLNNNSLTKPTNNTQNNENISKILPKLNKTEVNSFSKNLNSFADIFVLDDNFNDDFDDNFDKDYYDDEYNSINASENAPSRNHSSIHSYNKVDEKEFENHVFIDKNKIEEDNTRVLRNPVDIFVATENDQKLKTYSNIPNSYFALTGNLPQLPPPSRSQALKYYDLNINLDSEIPGVMSNLYFIDEKEEDHYNKDDKLSDDDYLDEINSVPEDFYFSDSEQGVSPIKSPFHRSNTGSFRRTHSFSGKPVGVAKDSTPLRNKLEIKNKTVTFFNHQWSPSSYSGSFNNQRSPRKNMRLAETVEYPIDEEILSAPKRDNNSQYNLITPERQFGKPTPEYIQDYSLSPIQEGSSSVDSSPKIR